VLPLTLTLVAGGEVGGVEPGLAASAALSGAWMVVMSCSRASARHTQETLTRKLATMAGAAMPRSGDSVPGPAQALFEHPSVTPSVVPPSDGAVDAVERQRAPGVAYPTMSIAGSRAGRHGAHGQIGDGPWPRSLLRPALDAAPVRRALMREGVI
jgi:hypothetical protein